MKTSISIVPNVTVLLLDLITNKILFLSCVDRTDNADSDKRTMKQPEECKGDTMSSDRDSRRDGRNGLVLINLMRFDR